MRWGSGRGAQGLVAVALLASAACGDDTPSTDARSDSSPFTVGYVPAGFEPVAAGTGSGRLAWGDDSEGTTSPLTVLQRNGGGSRQPVLVTFYGYEGTQGQSALPWGDDDVALELDGHPGAYLPASREAGYERWSTVVVDFGDDLAVRVTTPDASQQELVDIVNAVEIPDPGDPMVHVRAPQLGPLPAGVSVVGSMDARAVLAQDSYVGPSSDDLPGPPESHAATWVGEGADLERQLVVQTLPGDTADLPGIAGAAQEDVVGRIVEVDGRPAAVVESTDADSDPQRERAVWIEATWGDLVHVVSRGPEPLPLEEVGAIAASVEQASTGEWASLVDDVTDGGRLRPDVGFVTVASGELEGTGWLLQGSLDDQYVYEPGSGPYIDSCFKLSTGERDCASQFAVGPLIDTTGTSGRILPLFVVTTVEEAAAIRLTLQGDVTEVPAQRNEELNLWFAVFEDGEPGPLRCDPGAASTLEAIDEQGQVLRCLASP